MINEKEWEEVIESITGEHMRHIGITSDDYYCPVDEDFSASLNVTDVFKQLLIDFMKEAKHHRKKYDTVMADNKRLVVINKALLGMSDSFKKDKVND